MNNGIFNVNKLSDARMRELGFTDCVSSRWYVCKSVEHEITFNLSIDKSTLEYEIDVLDESFLQPYDYQYILKIDPINKFANNVRINVQEIINKFVDAGLIEYKE